MHDNIFLIPSLCSLRLPLKPDKSRARSTEGASGEKENEEGTQQQQAKKGGGGEVSDRAWPKRELTRTGKRKNRPSWDTSTLSSTRTVIG